MKKLFSLCLAMILLFALFACSSEGTGATEPAAAGLQVGFGRESIMPQDFTKAHLAGGDAAKRVAKSIKDNLYITCVAFKQGEEVFLLYTMDAINASSDVVNPAKTAITQLTGVPSENIMMCATHTHAGVSLTYAWDGQQNHVRMFNEAAAYAGKNAIKDLTPAEVYHGNVETEKMAFVRHYKLSDGSYAGSNFGNFANGTIVGHSEDADGQFQLVKFVREGKKDVVMMNFPAHATFASTADTYISADYPGPTREYIEANSNSLVAFFAAAAGNQTPNSSMPGEAIYSRKQYKEYGAALGKYAVDALPTLTKTEDTTFMYMTKSYTGKSNKEKLELLALAPEVVAAGKEYGNIHAKTVELARKNGFSSYYEANAVIGRSKTPATRQMNISAMTIGNVGFIFAPYEMFSSQGRFIKENSVCDTTFISTCSGSSWGYMPDALGIEIGCYESCVTNFAPGTGEDLAQVFVDMLAQLQNK